MAHHDLLFTPEAWEGYQYWNLHNKKIHAKLNRLIEETRRTPFSGTGKPEALKDNYTGLWSWRITQEHRLIYQVAQEYIRLVARRFHYGNK